jgi:hypothetical protein
MNPPTTTPERIGDVSRLLDMISGCEHMGQVAAIVRRMRAVIRISGGNATTVAGALGPYADELERIVDEHAKDCE